MGPKRKSVTIRTSKQIEEILVSGKGQYPENVLELQRNRRVEEMHIHKPNLLSSLVLTEKLRKREHEMLAQFQSYY